jgi:hypothetical protein
MATQEKDQQLRIQIDDNLNELASEFGWNADDLEEFCLNIIDNIRDNEDDEDEDDDE